MQSFNWRKPVIYTLLYLSGSKIPQYLKEIESLEKLSHEEIKKYQAEKLEKLLLHAYQHVPYYHKILPKVGVIDKNGQVKLENFHKIPSLTKEVIRKEKNRLYSKDHIARKSYPNHSGGSSGEPIDILQEKKYSDWNIANKIHYKSFANQYIGDKELRLWGAERDILKSKVDLKQTVVDFVYNRKNLNAFRMTISNMRYFVDEINSFKPTWIEAYVQPMYELAKFIEENNLKAYSPKGVLVSAGTLYPHMRETISRVFSCKVYNRYGSREVGDIACSCDLGKLHVSEWNNFIEVDSKNKIGNFFVTNLNNYAMPIIRYDIGDIGSKIKHRCGCGRSTGLLGTVEGREMSVFKARDGSVIPAEFFIHFVGVVFNDGGIKKFQVIQEGYEQILIKYVSNQKDIKKLMSKVEESIGEVMGENVKISWLEVKDIEKMNSGKYLYTLRNF